MERGLEDRRIALFAAGDGGELARALGRAGANTVVLSGGIATRDEDWHGARYAALVIADVDQNATGKEPRLVQLTREFMVADKPLAVLGGGIQVLHEAGGIEADALVSDSGTDAASFAQRVVGALSEQLDESRLDEMVDESFPASDPPSTTPVSIGRPARPSESKFRG